MSGDNLRAVKYLTRGLELSKPSPKFHNVFALELGILESKGHSWDGAEKYIALLSNDSIVKKYLQSYEASIQQRELGFETVK